jgi:hypothetical protein
MSAENQQFAPAKAQFAAFADAAEWASNVMQRFRDASEKEGGMSTTLNPENPQVSARDR